MNPVLNYGQVHRDSSGSLVLNIPNATVVYPDGSIEATSRAAEFVAAGKARWATPAEVRSYERAFEVADEAAFD